MITLDRILCPIDFSGHSRIALDYATAIARWYESEILLLHAYIVAMAPTPVAASPAPAGVPMTREDAARDLAEFARTTVAADVPCRTELVAGTPARHILETAARWPADLVVMGTHGASGFERLVLGSVTEKVLRKAASPVLVVPRNADAPGGEPVVFRRVLCAMDFSPCSQKALSYAISLAAESGGALTLLHVVETLDDEALADVPFDIEAYRRARESAAVQQLERMLPEDLRAWCECATLVRTGKPYQEILAAARELQADLVVLGVRGRNAVDLALFGSTANQVVRAAECPVLTARS